MSYEYILFDLDGTLTEPYEGITKSVSCALEAFGLPVPEAEQLKEYIGPPLVYSFEHFAGLKGDDITEAIRIFRERYERVGLFENSLIDGAEELLASLKQSGKKLILATSKLQEVALRILEKFGIDGYFDFVSGSTRDGTRITKEDVLEHCISGMNIRDKSKAVLVGDRMYDVDGARYAGIDCIGVLCGYGSREELIGADYIAEKLIDVRKIVCE